MTKIDFDAFICSIMSFDPVSNEVKYLIKEAIRLQGLEYKDGKIVEIDQKPLTEEQKAKFKVGDWVVDYLGNFIQIIDIYPSFYKVKEPDQRTYNYDFESVEEDCHLWTIQDAKPGDVLIWDNDRPFLFMGLLSDKYGTICCAYCGINGSGKFSVNTHLREAWCDADGVFPANKEQRDNLWLEMEKVGYKWNQKELKLEKIDKPDIAYINGAISSEDEQGIDKSSCTSTKENNKPETIKFKTKDAEIYQDNSILFQDSFDNLKKRIDIDKVDIEKMIEEYRNTLDPKSHLVYNLQLTSSYRQGLEDMLKLIKEGGE